ITFREVNFEDSDALMLTEPMLSAPFRRQVRLHRLKYPHEETQVQDNNESTRYYYHNHIVSHAHNKTQIIELGNLLAHDEQDHQEEVRELEEYKQEQREKEQIDREWEEITTISQQLNPFESTADIYELQCTGTSKSEKLKEKDNPDQQNENLEDYFDQLDRLDLDNSARQRADRLEDNEQQYQLERTQRIHDEFNNIPEIELRTFRLLDEEIAEDMRRLDYMQFRDVDFEDADALMLSEPFNQALFRHEVRKHRQKYPREKVEKTYSRRGSDDFEPTRHYYNNHIVNKYDIENRFGRVGQLELQINNFIIAFGFGYIVEKLKYDEDQAQIVTYSIRYPHNNILNTLNIEQQNTSKEKLEEFIQYLPAKIIEDQEGTLEDIKTRFITIVSIVVVAYRARGGNAAPADSKFFAFHPHMSALLDWMDPDEPRIFVANTYDLYRDVIEGIIQDSRAIAAALPFAGRNTPALNPTQTQMPGFLSRFCSTEIADQHPNSKQQTQ
ncbi:MAG: hypothetical protein EZS28_006680, partial [Streblomastix strix]